MRRAALFTLLAAPLLALSSAQATGGIQVAPVLVNISPERGISSIRLRNERDRAASFEVDAYLWTQQDGHDVLEPTSELMAAPGVFEIAAHAEQIIRIGAHVRNASGERAYRIVLRELPRTPASGATLGFTLEMSLPVFVTAADAAPNLHARLTDGELTLANAGDAHIQIAAIESNGAPVDAPRYVLAGVTTNVPIEQSARTVRLRVADGEGGVRELDVHADAQIASAAAR